MAKILFVLPRMGGGGAERVVSILANNLSKNGDNVVSIHTFVSGESFYRIDEKVILTDCGIKKVKKGLFRKLSVFINFPKAFFRTRKLIKKGNFDYVLSFLAEADITLWLCKKTGVKFTHVCSEINDPRKKGRLKRFFLKKTYKRADKFVCQSQTIANFYSFIDSNKKVVIPNPLNPQILPKRDKDLKNTVVAVGRLTAQKNFTLLINAFSRVLQKFPDYSLEIYGEGGERSDLERQIERLGLAPKIELKGAQKGVLDKIKNAKLFVMSSDYEGFPNALLESMGIGLPVVCTDFFTGTARELIDEKGGMLVPTGDENALATAIVKMLSKPDLESFGEYNLEKAKNYYEDVIVEKWKELVFNLK